MYACQSLVLNQYIKICTYLSLCTARLTKQPTVSEIDIAAKVTVNGHYKARMAEIKP